MDLVMAVACQDHPERREHLDDLVVRENLVLQVFQEIPVNPQPNHVNQLHLHPVNHVRPGRLDHQDQMDHQEMLALQDNQEAQEMMLHPANPARKVHLDHQDLPANQVLQDNQEPLLKANPLLQELQANQVIFILKYKYSNL